jgi:hypothetical protein
MDGCGILDYGRKHDGVVQMRGRELNQRKSIVPPALVPFQLASFWFLGVRPKK